MSLRRLSALIVALWAASGGVARANGRFPEANQLVVDPTDPTDPTHLIARTTFGILRSFDGGASWTWLCEEAISPLGLLDEELLITTGGRTSVALTDGIAIDDGEGCDWTRVGGELLGRRVVDLVGDGNDPAVAYAALQIPLQTALQGQIARTTDGRTWSFIGAPLEGTLPLTIDVARGRPQRLYLGATDGNFEFGFIDTSDDAGETWTRHAAPRGADSAYVSAIDPTDPDRVYVRGRSAENALYVSEDAGQSWATLYVAPTPLTGFALSPDGTRIAVGGADGLVILERADGAGGVSVFSTVRLTAVSAKCLTWSSAGLFVCADETADEFTIGLSSDEGDSFRPMLQLADLRPGWCASGSAVARLCSERWCGVATTIGASCAPAARPGADQGGCSCDLTAGSKLGGATGQALLIVLFAAVARRAGRRRRRGAVPTERPV